MGDLSYADKLNRIIGDTRFFTFLYVDMIFHVFLLVLIINHFIAMWNGCFYHEYNVAFWIFFTLSNLGKISMIIEFTIKACVGRHKHKTRFKKCKRLIVGLKVVFFMIPLILTDMFMLSFYLTLGFGFYNMQDEYKS